MHEPLNLPRLRKEQRRVAALMQSQQTVDQPHKIKRRPLNLDYVYWCSRIDPDGHHRNPGLNHLQHGLRTLRGKHPCDFLSATGPQDPEKKNNDNFFQIKKKKSNRIDPKESHVLPGIDFSEEYDYEAWRRRTAPGRKHVQSLDTTLDDHKLGKSGHPAGQSLDSALARPSVKLPSIGQNNRVSTHGSLRERENQAIFNDSHKLKQSSQVSMVSKETSLPNVTTREQPSANTETGGQKKKRGKVQFGVKSEYYFTGDGHETLQPHVSRLDSEASLITQVQAANSMLVPRNETPPRLLYTHVKEKRERDRLASVVTKSHINSEGSWCECGEEYRKGRGGVCKNCGKKRRKKKEKEDETQEELSDLKSGQLLYNRHGIEETPPIISPDVEKFLLKSILKNKKPQKKGDFVNENNVQIADTTSNNDAEEDDDEWEFIPRDDSINSNKYSDKAPDVTEPESENGVLSQQSKEGLLSKKDIHRDAYLAALNEARFQVLPREPWMLGTNVSRAFVFSYYEHIPEDCQCDKCTDARLAKVGGARGNKKKVAPPSKKRATKSKTNEMTSIFGEVKIADHYPGGSKGWRQYDLPVKRRKKKLETVISTVLNSDTESNGTRLEN